MANALLRSFGRSALSSVPAHFQGDPGTLCNWLGAGPSLFTVVSAKLNITRGGRSSAAELLALLPQDLAAAARPAG